MSYGRTRNAELAVESANGVFMLEQALISEDMQLGQQRDACPNGEGIGERMQRWRCRGVACQGCEGGKRWSVSSPKEASR